MQNQETDREEGMEKCSTRSVPLKRIAEGLEASDSKTHVSSVVVDIYVLDIYPFVEVGRYLNLRRHALLRDLGLDIPITAARRAE